MAAQPAPSSHPTATTAGEPGEPGDPGVCLVADVSGEAGLDGDPGAQPDEPKPRRDRSRYALAALMGGAGALHMVAPRIYEPIVPGWIGHERAVVYASGVVELVCAALLANRRTSRAGAWLTVATVAGVYPANIQMAIDAGVPSDPLGVAAWARLPLQVPLIAWAHRHTRP